jgi:polysaccharide pyruvyl transferase WcaK-like protein
MELKKKKILLVNDTYDDNNLGCKATSVALYKLIDKYLNDCTIIDVIKLYHTERPELDSIIPKASLDDYESKSTQNYLDATPSLQFELGKIANCDVVIINGEGSIYKAVLKCRYILYFAYIAKKIFAKKVYLINHSADISAVKDIARKVYPILDGVAVREPVSYRELLNVGIHNAIQAPDAVFSFDRPILSVFMTGYHLVLI